MKLNDFPMIAEIKEEYMRLRQSGCSREEAVDALQDSYQNELTIGAEDDGLLFWVGLADAQYALKELSLEVSEKAIVALDKLDQPKWAMALNDFIKRRKNYSAAPMVERKTLPKSRKFRCAWKMGDTFAYLLSGQEASECEIAGKYILLRKVDEVEFGDGRLLPIVTLTLWDDKPLPTNSKEFQRIPPLKLVCGRMEFPRNKYEYRTEILFTSKKTLNDLSLCYIGNYPDVTMPDDEVFTRNPAHILMTLPKEFEEDCCLRWKSHKRYTTRIKG